MWLKSGNEIESNESIIHTTGRYIIKISPLLCVPPYKWSSVDHDVIKFRHITVNSQTPNMFTDWIGISGLVIITSQMYFLSTRNTRNSVASGLTSEINTAHITNHITTLRPLCCTTVAGSKKTSVLFYAWSRKIEWTLFNEETSQKPIWDYKIGSIRSQRKWVSLNITDVGMLYWQKKKKKGIRETGNKTFKVKKPGEDSPFKNKWPWRVPYDLNVSLNEQMMITSPRQQQQQKVYLRR